jgi:hypothetical protein
MWSMRGKTATEGSSASGWGRAPGRWADDLGLTGWKDGLQDWTRFSFRPEVATGFLSFSYASSDILQSSPPCLAQLV